MTTVTLNELNILFLVLLRFDQYGFDFSLFDSIYITIYLIICGLYYGSIEVDLLIYC